MRNQMRLIEQRKVSYILDDIRDNIEAAKKMMEKPYEEANEDRFNDAREQIRNDGWTAHTLCRLGIEEAREYKLATNKIGEELIAWRWPHVKA